ncbi:pyruvate oxidase [Sporosarcina sp. NCCP-2716]|uniref:thiamine pyrophosphate-binding protein n=1 Tax=Sporosarcina sp. NCCP-2716 TaxID=2943679 RepID=UPI00203FCE0E|nr:thiamine pyrophosphate-binding protein [Sporosarcina sp. NCCP-2716]GKV69771.1 pyruvate oxidase [Sporosarcina sp. NCCP-2716]
MANAEKTVAQVMLEQLSLYGVKRIYGVVGDASFGLIDALAGQDAIEFIACKHESVAAFMASAEAKLTGGLGVCTSTMGPGATNLLNGLGDAHADHVPVLALTGQAPTEKIGTEFQQYVNLQDLMKPFALYSDNLASADAAIDLLERAAATSLNKRGVTHLSVPKDLFMAKTSAAPRPLADVIEGTAVFTEDSLAKAVSVMKSAKRPMILAGAGAAGAVDDLKRLAENWGAGILASLGGKGLVEAEFPQMLQGIGEGGNPFAADLFKEADVVLLAGTTWWPEGYVPTDAQVIQVDRQFDKIEKTIPVDLGITGKSEDVLPILADGLGGFTRSDDWLARCSDVKAKWDRQNEEEGSTDGFPFHPSRIVRALDRTVAADAVLALDTGDNTVWMNRNFRQTDQTVLVSGYWRTMGFGLPAAMAAKLAEPGRQVVAVVGDGGLQMVLADLLTATRYGLDITVVVLNNESLQMEVDKLKVLGAKGIGTDLTNPDFVQVAEACGWKGFRPGAEDDLEAVLEDALGIEGPALVDVRTAQAFFPETE